MLLVAEELGRDFGSLRAVDAISFSVNRSEVFGLLGPNGAGKTTTISMIAGLLEPTRGRVTIDGFDVTRAPKEARRRLGLVPQELAVYGELSARANLQFFAGLYGLKGAARDAAVDWALELAGLRDRADGPVKSFSGGMKRRLNLVCGLVHRPPLVVLDEPTVGVDPQSRNFLFEAIEGLRESGVGVLYTSHYMEEVEALCERVAIVDKGRLVALDRVDRLIAEHAGAAVHIDYRGDEDRVRAALSGRDDLVITAQRVTARDLSGVGALVGAIEAAGAVLTDLRSEQGNLESVFLHLTGRLLRDES